MGKVGKANAAAASAVASSGVMGSIVLAQGHTNPRVQVTSCSLQCCQPIAHMLKVLACFILQSTSRSSMRISTSASMTVDRKSFLSSLHAPYRAMCSRPVLSFAALRSDPSANCVQEAANKSLCSLSEESKVSAERLLQTDTLAKIKQQLDGTDPAVKQTGLATVASLASASAELADAVVDEPLLDAIAQLLRAPELPPDLHTAACQALANAASHTLELAERIRASGTCSSRILAVSGLHYCDALLGIVTNMHQPALCLAAVHDQPLVCGKESDWERQPSSPPVRRGSTLGNPAA